MWTEEEKRFLFQRLDMIDATLEALMKRQWYIASIAYFHDNEEIATHMMSAMSEILDDYTEAIKDIRDRYEGI